MLVERLHAVVGALGDRFVHLLEGGRRPALLMQDAFVASLFVRPAGAATETDLYWHDNSVIRDISPDGRQILFSEGAASVTTDWITYLRNVDGSPAIKLGEGLATAFSPDATWAMTRPVDATNPLGMGPTGLGLTFADAAYPGIDLILPDLAFIEEEQSSVRGRRGGCRLCRPASPRTTASP